MELSRPAAAAGHRRAFVLAAAAWTAAAGALSLYLLETRVDDYRARTAENAQIRLVALRDTLALTFRQLAALPVNLSHSQQVRQFLERPPLPGLDSASEDQIARTRAAELQDPQVLAMNRVLDDAVRDFGLPVGFVTDVSGHIRASGIADPRVPPVLIANNVRRRDYFISALARGAGSQFMMGMLSGVPGIYFSARVGEGDAPAGAVVVKQDAPMLSRLLSDADGGRVLVTDANEVIVLGNQSADLMKRLPGPATLSEQESRAVYGQPLQTFDWRVERSGVGSMRALVVDVSGERQVLLSSPLEGWPFTVWVLSPLSEEAGLVTNIVAWALAIWAGGGLMLWAFWRRQQLLREAVGARRELLDLAHALPLSVFRFYKPLRGSGRFSFVGRDPGGLLGLREPDLQAAPSAAWGLIGEGHITPPTRPVEFPVRHGDRLTWVEVNSTPQTDLSGGTVYNGYWLDVTGRRETEVRLAALFEHAPSGYLFFGRRVGITHCNPAALRLFGHAEQHPLIGRVPWFPPLSADAQSSGKDSRAKAIELMRRHIETGQRVQSFEWRFRRRDGSFFDAQVAVIALEWDGDPRFCAVIEDITVRKQAQEAMQRARQDAEVASQTKSNFLANMSHELRTPMNAIIGMTHLALEDGLPPRQQDYVRKANSAAQSLLQILNDILDMSKIEAGRLELEQIEFELEQVIGDMADVLGLKADEKGLELLFTAAPDLPARLVGDPTRLRQVLINLGGNAIKFTEEGEVTVGMEVQSRDAEGMELHAWVRDTGMGLSTEELGRLFQPFTQADSSTTRRFGGTGLGLTISRQLVERMGGRLWVESAPGVGSTFHFTARLGVAANAPVQRAWMAGELRGRRALVVDDNPAALDVVTRMIEPMGVQVDRANSGAEGLTLIDRAPDAYSWILLDWKMPEIDGLTCARRIVERHPHLRERLVLLTAFSRDEALDASRGLPLAGVLQKPVTPSTLYDCLVRTRGHDGATRLSASTPARPGPGGPRAEVALRSLERLKRSLAGSRVLLVEDHPLNQELACELLKRAGMEVVVAKHGEEALERLASQSPFDAVLMDCQMPVMDGYTATEHLRADPRWQDLPVIAMTASALPEDRERALASGMNAHITKPLDVERMLSTLVEWVKPGRGAAADPVLAESDKDWPPPAVTIDTADGLERCMGRPDLYRRLLIGFREAKSTLAAELTEAMTNEDWNRAQRRTHDLKGLAGTIGAHGLQAAAERLHAAVSRRDSAEASKHLSVVSTDLGAVLAEIDQLVPPAADPPGSAPAA